MKSIVSCCLGPQIFVNPILYYNVKDYVNINFHHLYEECGIQMQHSIPYTPQQNGVFERKNRELKEMATCMIEAKDLSPNLYDEAINYA